MTDSAYVDGSVELIPSLFKATKNNVLGEDISSIVRKGHVEYNPDRSVKFTMKMTIGEHGVVRSYADYLAPFLTTRYPDGHEVTSQLGLYSVVPPKETVNQQARDIQLIGRDLTWLLSLDVFEQGYSVSAGVNIVLAVTLILVEAGFTRVSIMPSSATTTTPRSWPPETTKLAIINDLLTSIGFYSLTTTKDGYLTSSPYQSVVNPTVVTRYDTTDTSSRVRVVRDVRFEPTPDRIANKVVVIKDNATEDPIVVTKVNNNPLSPTSTEALGMTIAKRVKNPDIADEDAANLIATRTLEEASTIYHRLKLFTTADVERSPNEVYSLNIVNAAGEVVADGNWHCRGWKIGFTPADGPMEHNLSSIQYPPMSF